MNSLLKWKNATPVSMDYSRNPFFNFQHEVDGAFRDFYNMFSASKQTYGQFENLTIMPSMDIIEDKDQFTAQVEMPGMDEKDIKVSFSDNMLHISGEKSFSKKNENKKYHFREISFGHYERSITIPQYLDTNKAKASFKKGMLWVTIPKSSKEKYTTHDVKVERLQ